MIKKIFSHSLIYGVAPQIPRLAFFLILPFIMPFLTKNDFGVFGIVTAYTLALNSIKELGLRVVFSNTLIKHPNHIKKLWGHLYGFLYLWNFVFALIIILILYFIIPVEASEKRWLIILLNVLPIVFFGVTMTIGQIYYQFTKRPMQIAARALIIGSIAVWLNYYTMAILKIGYMGFFWSAFVSAILYNISYWYPLNFIENIKPKFCFKWKFIKSSLKIGLPLVPHSFAAYLINTSDRIIHAKFKCKYCQYR
jgi:O-antigen/teichoic acid export membrane protein